jgi:hypothetical protein
MVCRCLIKQNKRDFERSCSRYKENEASEKTRDRVEEIRCKHRDSHTFRTVLGFAFDFVFVFTTTCFLGSGSESLLSDSDDEEESDESEESETAHFQSTFARKIHSCHHVPSVLALLFLALLGLFTFDCLFIAGILLFLWLLSKNCRARKMVKLAKKKLSQLRRRTGSYQKYHFYCMHPK